MKLWSWLGRIAHFISWPGLYLFLNNTKRTRIIVHSKGKVLVLKDWLGDGSWKLPGGGIHKGEASDLSAMRELKEETGIEIKQDQLKYLGELETKQQGIKATLVVFGLQLSENTLPQKHKFEIIAAEWKELGELNGQIKVSDNTQLVMTKFGQAALS